MRAPPSSMENWNILHFEKSLFMDFFYFLFITFFYCLFYVDDTFKNCITKENLSRKILISIFHAFTFN